MWAVGTVADTAHAQSDIFKVWEPKKTQMSRENAARDHFTMLLLRCCVRKSGRSDSAAIAAQAQV
jgi:hypothetical protein